MRDRMTTWILAVLLAVNIMISGCIVRELRQVEEAVSSLPEDRHMTLLCTYPKVDKQQEEQTLTYIGTFRATAYCGCRKCNGKWTGYGTASGTDLVEGRTIASDWDVLPAGTEVYIDGIGWRTAEDTGSGIDGNRLDIYFDSHDAALAFGVQDVDVWMAEAK